MYKLREFMNINVLKSIYYSLIYSHIVYGIQVWGSACPTELDCILILQNKAVRMMTYSDHYSPSSGHYSHACPLFKKLGILKVGDVFKFHVIKFIFSCLCKNTPSIFSDWFILNYTVHNYNTQSNTTCNMRNYFEIEEVVETNTLHIRGSRLVNYGAKKMQVSGPKLWNSLPTYIRNSQSIYSLKYSLKKYLLDQYE